MRADGALQLRGGAFAFGVHAACRVYGGIHYRFDNEAGQTAGRAVAEGVFANFVRRK